MTTKYLARMTCPWCGRHGTSDIVNHPGGRFLCSCGSLHNGTDAEWRRLEDHRAGVAKRLGEPSTTTFEEAI